MDNERFEQDLRRYLKKFGVTTQGAVQDRVREGLGSGRLAGKASVRIRSVVTLEGVEGEFVVDGELSLEE